MGKRGAIKCSTAWRASRALRSTGRRLRRKENKKKRHVEIMHVQGRIVRTNRDPDDFRKRAYFDRSGNQGVGSE